MSDQTKAIARAIHVNETGDQLILKGTALKNAGGSLQIKFDAEFDAVPTVVVSPFWQGSNSQVGSIETVTTVNTTDFVVTSSNAGSNYFVNWIAIGRPSEQ